MPQQLEDLLRDQLVLFDEVLSKQGIRLWERPFRAATLVVQHCILEIKGDTKDNFFLRPWFGAVYQTVEDWYSARYGEAMEASHDRTAFAAVSIHDTPFGVEVPLAVSEPPLPDNTIWLGFPAVVRPDEDTLAWIQVPPNLDSLSQAERDRLNDELRSTSGHLRQIYVALLTAVHPNKSAASLTRSVLQHLEKAAHDLVRARPDSLPLAIWEVNFACEKIIKAFLLHKNIAPPRIHDVNRLHELGLSCGGPAEASAHAKAMPTEKDAVKHRYCETHAPQLSEVFDIYRAGLAVSSGYVRCLKRSYTLDEARFQLRLPPWRKRT